MSLSSSIKISSLLVNDILYYFELRSAGDVFFDLVIKGKLTYPLICNICPPTYFLDWTCRFVKVRGIIFCKEDLEALIVVSNFQSLYVEVDPRLVEELCNFAKLKVLDTSRLLSNLNINFLFLMFYTHQYPSKRD